MAGPPGPRPERPFLAHRPRGRVWAEPGGHSRPRPRPAPAPSLPPPCTSSVAAAHRGALAPSCYPTPYRLAVFTLLSRTGAGDGEGGRGGGRAFSPRKFQTATVRCRKVRKSCAGKGVGRAEEGQWKAVRARRGVSGGRLGPAFDQLGPPFDQLGPPFDQLGPAFDQLMGSFHPRCEWAT
jgi:hypothetical protein